MYERGHIQTDHTIGEIYQLIKDYRIANPEPPANLPISKDQLDGFLIWLHLKIRDYHKSPSGFINLLRGVASATGGPSTAMPINIIASVFGAYLRSHRGI